MWLNLKDGFCKQRRKSNKPEGYVYHRSYITLLADHKKGLVTVLKEKVLTHKRHRLEQENINQLSSDHGTTANEKSFNTTTDTTLVEDHSPVINILQQQLEPQQPQQQIPQTEQIEHTAVDSSQLSFTEEVQEDAELISKRLRASSPTRDEIANRTTDQNSNEQDQVVSLGHSSDRIEAPDVASQPTGKLLGLGAVEENVSRADPVLQAGAVQETVAKPSRCDDASALSRGTAPNTHGWRLTASLNVVPCGPVTPGDGDSLPLSPTMIPQSDTKTPPGLSTDAGARVRQLHECTKILDVIPKQSVVAPPGLYTDMETRSRQLDECTKVLRGTLECEGYKAIRNSESAEPGHRDGTLSKDQQHSQTNPQEQRNHRVNVTSPSPSQLSNASHPNEAATQVSRNHVLAIKPDTDPVSIGWQLTASLRVIPVGPEPSNIYEQRNTGLEQKIAERNQDGLGGLQNAQMQQEGLERQLREAAAEAAEYKKLLADRQVQYIAANDAVIKVTQEKANIQKRLGNATTLAIYYQDQFRRLQMAREDEAIPDAIQKEDIVEKLRHEVKCQAAAAKAHLKDLKIARNEHVLTLRQKTVQIEHMQEQMKRLEYSTGRIIHQSEAYEARVMDLATNAVAPMGLENRERILEMFREVQEQAYGWKMRLQEHMAASDAVEKQLLIEKERRHAARGEIFQLQAQRDGFEAELEGAHIEVSRLEARASRINEQAQVHTQNWKEAYESLQQEQERLQARLDQVIGQRFGQHVQMLYAEKDRVIEGLRASNEAQAEEINRLELKLRKREEMLGDGYCDNIFSAAEAEVWRQRAERAERACAQMDPNPLLAR